MPLSSKEYFDEMKRFRFAALAYQNSGSGRLLRSKKRLRARKCAQLFIGYVQKNSRDVGSLTGEGLSSVSADSFEGERNEALKTFKIDKPIRQALSRVVLTGAPSNADQPLHEYVSAWCEYWLDAIDGVRRATDYTSPPNVRIARVRTMAALNGVFLGTAASDQTEPSKSRLTRIAAMTLDDLPR